MKTAIIAARSMSVMSCLYWFSLKYHSELLSQVKETDGKIALAVLVFILNISIEQTKFYQQQKLHFKKRHGPNNDITGPGSSVS